VSGALLARETGHCLVPVAHDAGHYWPRRGLFKKSGTIRVVIGKPIKASESDDPRALNEAAQTWIESTLKRLGG
jgi:1-acyl-sn-glycerol-3-phosphate acyltransferase